MDELQCITTGVMRVMACDNIMPPRPTPVNINMESNICYIHITRTMVPIPRRASSCLALALSLLLSSLSHLSFSLSCCFFFSLQAPLTAYISEYKQNVVTQSLPVMTKVNKES